MLKKFATASVLTATIGGVLLTAGTAQADDGSSGWGGSGYTRSSNVQILPIQFCRGVDILAIHNLLSYDREDGPCANGPVNDE